MSENDMTMAQKLVLQAWLQPSHPPLTHAYFVARMRLEGSGEAMPSMSAIRRFIRCFEAQNRDMVLLIRHGWKRRMANNIKHVPNEVLHRMRAVIDDGIANGRTLPEVKAAMDRVIGK